MYMHTNSLNSYHNYKRKLCNYNDILALAVNTNFKNNKTTSQTKTFQNLKAKCSLYKQRSCARIIINGHHALKHKIKVCIYYSQL